MAPPKLPRRPPEVSKDSYDLLRQARQAATRAAATYSHLHVGAAVRTRRDVYLGCNVEEPAQAGTVHAEQSAIARAVFTEGRRMLVEEVAIFAYRGDTGARADTASPCGTCRQLLLEHAAGARVIFASGAGIGTDAVADLLPTPFALG